MADHGSQNMAPYGQAKSTHSLTHSQPRSGKMLRYARKENGVTAPFSGIAEEGLEPPTRGL